MSQETNPESNQAHSDAQSMTRREAMLQLLRVGGIAAGAAGVGLWLNERSHHPEPAAAEQARDGEATARVAGPGSSHRSAAFW